MSNSNYLSSIIDTIKELVPSAVSQEAITESTHLQADLGIDSMTFITLIFKFEQLFDVQLQMIVMENPNIETVGDLNQLILDCK